MRSTTRLQLDPKLVPALTLKAKLSMASQPLRRWQRRAWSRPSQQIPPHGTRSSSTAFSSTSRTNCPAAIPALEKAYRLNPRDRERRYIWDSGRVWDKRGTQDVPGGDPAG